MLTNNIKRHLRFSSRCVTVNAVLTEGLFCWSVSLVEDEIKADRSTAPACDHHTISAAHRRRLVAHYCRRAKSRATRCPSLSHFSLERLQVPPKHASRLSSVIQPRLGRKTTC